MGIIKFGPPQNSFSEDDIQNMLSSPRRRQITEDWAFIRHPQMDGQDYGLAVPFPPLARDHISWIEGNNFTYYTYLKEVTEKEIRSIEDYFESIIGCIAIRDCLPISFAIDFEREEGCPTREQTEIGRIRRKAKPYGTEAVELSHYSAADELAEKVINFIEKVKFYNNLDAVVGMPPSDPDKEYILTHYLAGKVAAELKFEDLSQLIIKQRKTPAAKNLPVDKKLEAIRGSLSVSEQVAGRKILLLDDLYQSGVTTNYAAMLLLLKGAVKVYSLACEKTCRNDDNTGASNC